MSKTTARTPSKIKRQKWRAMEGVQVVGNSQCLVAFREQYSLQVSLEHGQRRWRRDEIWQTVPHLRRGHGKGTVANSGQPRRKNDESVCWRQERLSLQADGRSMFWALQRSPTIVRSQDWQGWPLGRRQSSGNWLIKTWRLICIKNTTSRPNEYEYQAHRCGLSHLHYYQSCMIPVSRHE